jgi:hypothetical protein
METDGKYDSVTRKLPERNVPQEKYFLKYGLILTVKFTSVIKRNSVL